uniref:Uncharacterized protein n=1 Tax=Globodera rostochiensis TaxID=31243 RepID=A0A914GQG3_GLORO
MLILHISREIEHKDTNEYHEKLLAKRNWTTSNIGSDYFNKSKINGMIKRMPKTMHYFDAIRRCSRFINSYPSVPVHVIPPCLSYKLCALPKPKVKCTVTKSNYKLTEIEPTKLYRVHVLQQSYFEKKAGCFD